MTTQRGRKLELFGVKIDDPFLSGVGSFKVFGVCPRLSRRRIKDEEEEEEEKRLEDFLSLFVVL